MSLPDILTQPLSNHDENNVQMEMEIFFTMEYLVPRQVVQTIYFNRLRSG